MAVKLIYELRSEFRMPPEGNDDLPTDGLFFRVVRLARRLSGRRVMQLVKQVVR